MIVTTDLLPNFRHLVAMVDGCFDPLHHGHIEYFRAAAALGVPVLCNIADDAYLRAKHPPFLSGDKRALVIDAIRYISYTHLSAITTTEVLDVLRPRYYVKGEDWRGRLPPEQMALAERHGIEIVYLATVRDSSTRILDNYIEGLGVINRK